MYFLIRNEDKDLCGVIDGLHDPILQTKDIKENYHIIPVKDFLKDCKTDEDRINKVLNEARFYYDNWFEGKKFIIQITWGDWSHEHGFCNRLMSVLGYKLYSESVDEEDGSDCYSSTHVYMKAA